MRKYYLLTLMLFSLIKTSAQEITEKTTKTSTIRLGLEVGYDYFEAEAKDVENIYSKYTYSSFFYFCPPTDFKNMEAAYIGIKPEFLFAKNRWGVAAGIRISQYSSRFNIKEYDEKKDGWHFILFYDDEYSYSSLTNITQKSYFVGIPLELKYFLIKADKLFQPYIKLSTCFNFPVYTRNDLKVWSIYDSHGNFYHGEKFATLPDLHNEFDKGYIINAVRQQLGTPDILNIRTSLALGLKIGRSRYPFGNIEIHIPVIFNAKNVSSFVTPESGLGFQCSLQIPLKSHIK